MKTEHTYKSLPSQMTRVQFLNCFGSVYESSPWIAETAWDLGQIDSKALDSAEKLSNIFSQIVDEFLNFISGKRLVIHNAEFDITHLNNELKIAGKNIIDKTNVVDTLEIARNKFPGSQISLDALCKRYRIDNSKREKHTALIDCELLAKVYINLLDQKEPKLNFSNSVDINSVETQNKNITYSKKIVFPTSEELEQHREFLKRDLKKNFY